MSRPNVVLWTRKATKHEHRSTRKNRTRQQQRRKAIQEQTR